jgi:CheY-like chemotaxis protein
MAVLVVDDDEAIVYMLTLALREYHIDVVSAADGTEALSRLEPRPDAVVLDLQMPGMDGRALFKELRAQGVTAPVVLISAYDARAAQRELQADAAIEKPFDTSTLVDVLYQLITTR